jgi:hypothetical protein
MAPEILKIAVHILTTKTEIILTTRFRYDFVGNVSHKNNILSLGVSPTLNLAAGVWSTDVTETLQDARLDCLKYSVNELSSHWPNRSFWLLAADKAPRTESRIARHYGFWKGLQNRGIALPEGDFMGEYPLSLADGLRIFSGVRFELSQIVAIHAVMRVTQAAIVFLGEHEAATVVVTMAQRGWPIKNTKPPEEIVEFACSRSGIVIEAYGEFDDQNVAVAAIGEKKLIETIEGV